jgi:Zn-dependent M28 family amino/carboxypeptidase
MRLSFALPLLALLAGPAPASPRADQWWTDIARLAGDETEGRLTGSPGYLRAADYVVARLKAIGLEPAGEQGGFFQQVAFERQRIDQAGSHAALIAANGTTTALPGGELILFNAGGAPRPATVDAPLVFLGYGLHLPEQGHDDFAGIDLTGKIAVVISGGPANLPGPVKSANRSERAKLLAKAGAVGMITLTTPAQVEIPWARGKLLAQQAGMYLADAGLREQPDNFLVASLDPARSDLLFAGAPHRFADLAKLADASQPVPTFALPLRFRATVAIQRQPLTSPNVVARLPGRDPRLAAEHVVVSAHLDHLGIGAAIDGDRIYNGAMDDASGVASVLDIAARAAAGPRPRRTLLFVLVTAEEKGLLGSHYFARKPTVPRASIVADLNLDMPLPLWPLKSVIVQGEAESTLGAAARAVAARQGLAIAPDPLPERNSFTRTDQFSFVRTGVPALAFKFGFAKGTPEFAIERDWRANRYHSPGDDLDQPGVLKEEAIRLNDFVAAIADTVANQPARPQWLKTSPFKRYAGEPQ